MLAAVDASELKDEVLAVLSLRTCMGGLMRSFFSLLHLRRSR